MLRPTIATAILLIIATAASSQIPEIIAHRGASADAPENTMAAFKLGWAQNADACELDLYLTRDGKVIVIHDADAKRTTGSPGLVASRDFAELRTLDAGSWKGAAWNGEKLPTVSEALATIPQGRRFFLEIKCGPEVLPELQREIKTSGRPAKDLVIIGFSYPTMVKSRALFPDIPHFWLASGAVDKKTGRAPELADLIAKAKAAKFDGLNLDAKFPIDSSWVAKAKADGLKLYVWTVDDEKAAAKLAAAGVDGITTNKPAALRQHLSAGVPTVGR